MNDTKTAFNIVQQFANLISNHTSILEKQQRSDMASAFRHHVVPIEGPLNPIGQSQLYHIRWFKGGPWLLCTNYVKRRESLGKVQPLYVFFLGLSILRINPLMPNGAFNICCPRDCVSRHNGGTRRAISDFPWGGNCPLPNRFSNKKKIVNFF